jgi:hypothetical protein
VIDWLTRRLPWLRHLRPTLVISRQVHERRLALVEDTHPDGTPRRLRLLQDDDAVDLVGGEQFVSLYLRTGEEEQQHAKRG